MVALKGQHRLLFFFKRFLHLTNSFLQFVSLKFFEVISIRGGGETERTSAS